MKKIVLIGDSTRMGYDKYIKEALDGVCEVYYASENGRYVTNVLRFAHDWKAKGGWPDDVDLVLWNSGLWDLLELFGDGPLVPVLHYEATVPRVDKRLRMLFPKAKIAFATSVSVIESRMGGSCIRRNSVIEEYNAAALRALENTDTVIFDLYTLTKDTPDSYRTDSVHFYTDAGREFVGKTVLSFICGELGIDLSRVSGGEAAAEEYTADNIGY